MNSPQSEHLPLNEEERATVEDGMEVMEKLCQQLAHVPTLAGSTSTSLAGEQPRRGRSSQLSQSVGNGRGSKRGICLPHHAEVIPINEQSSRLKERQSKQTLPFPQKQAASIGDRHRHWSSLSVGVR